MGRKGKGQGPQRAPLAERLAKIKSAEFIKEGEEAFERVLEHRRQQVDSQEMEMQKRMKVLKALCEKEEEEELDVSSLKEALQTPPAKGRRQHADGADLRRRELPYQCSSWLSVSRYAWPRRRRRHP